MLTRTPTYHAQRQSTSSFNMTSNCQLCHTTYNHEKNLPKKLPCSCTFCLFCLTLQENVQVQQNGLTFIQCPSCKSQFHNLEASDLETDQTILNTIDKIQQAISTPTAKMMASATLEQPSRRAQMLSFTPNVQKQTQGYFHKQDQEQKINEYQQQQQVINIFDQMRMDSKKMAATSPEYQFRNPLDQISTPSSLTSYPQMNQNQTTPRENSNKCINQNCTNPRVQGYQVCSQQCQQANNQQYKYRSKSPPNTTGRYLGASPSLNSLNGTPMKNKQVYYTPNTKNDSFKRQSNLPDIMMVDQAGAPNLVLDSAVDKFIAQNTMREQEMQFKDVRLDVFYEPNNPLKCSNIVCRNRKYPFNGTYLPFCGRRCARQAGTCF